MIRQKNIFGLFGFVLLLSGMLATGCLNLSDDIKPPLEISPTDSIVQTPVPTAAVIAADPVEEESGSIETSNGEILIEVIDHSGGLLLDQDLVVRLEGYDNFDRVVEMSSALPDAGYVVITDVPLVDERVYFASISYGGAVYRSNVIQVKQDSSDLVLQVQIFDTTTDDSGLIIDRIHVLIDFPGPDFIQVSEIYIISNFGDKTVVAKAADQPVVIFSLPEGATNIEFENGTLGQRYVRTADGFGDTVSIPPGSGVYQVLVYYNLPYQNAKLDFAQVMNYPVGAVVAMTPANRVKLKGSLFDDMGIQSIPSGDVQVYGGGVIEKGGKLEFRLSGKPDSLEGSQFSGLSRVEGYVIAIGILGIALILAGVIVFIRNRNVNGEVQPKTEVLDQKDQILDSIIALEDLYNDGEITEKVFHKKRDELKLKLNGLIREE